ncbi:MAG: NADH:flavin oxidoreductase [Desulfovibrionaceae bacterium]|nr:NADH:flavin oxidoreductase [Desulfovibrionaceae bacterium]
MKLLSPFAMGLGTLRNRVAYLPFPTAYAEKDGSVSPLMLVHYLRMAAAGPGLVVVEGSGINPRACAHRCLHVNRRTLPGFARLASAIKSTGCRVMLQLVHAGRFNYMNRVGPSPVPLFGRLPVREMAVNELKGIANDFAQAALIAKEAGFDGVELHGELGCLLASFLSPRTNVREDEYGGTPERRMAFPLEVAAAVRGAVGEWPVGYRLMAREFLEGGLAIEESQAFAVRLAEVLRPCYISVAAGSHECWTSCFHEGTRLPEVFGVHEAEAIKKAVPHVPVIASGRLGTPADCEALLERGGADMIGLSRALFADAEWIRKASGEVKEPIHPCTQCATCVRQVCSSMPAFCSQWSAEERLQRLKAPMIRI